MVGFCTWTTPQQNALSVWQSLTKFLHFIMSLTHHSMFCETSLLCKLKCSLKGTHFQLIEDIHNKAAERTFTKRFSEMLPGMAGMNAALCR
jgi:hypothetical protein